MTVDLKQAVRVLRGEIESYSMEKRYTKKDASHVWAKLNVSLACKPSGKPSYFIVRAEDIDERERQAKLIRR